MAPVAQDHLLDSLELDPQQTWTRNFNLLRTLDFINTKWLFCSRNCCVGWSWGTTPRPRWWLRLGSSQRPTTTPPRQLRCDKNITIYQGHHHVVAQTDDLERHLAGTGNHLTDHGARIFAWWGLSWPHVYCDTFVSAQQYCVQ